MKVLLAVIVLTGLALIGSRQRSEVARRRSVAGMMLSGAEFIVVGILLGGEFLNVIDATALEGLRPFVAVALGWIGFLFGVQFNRTALRRLPSGLLGISLAESALVLAVMVPTSVLIVWFLPHSSMAVAVTAGLALAASAACSGQSTLALVQIHRRARSRDAMTVLRYVSSVDPVIGVVAFGVIASFFVRHPPIALHLPVSLEWLGVSVVHAAVTAWIFVSLTLTRTSQSELVVYLLGVITLSAGVAYTLGLSTLFVSALSGVIVANLSDVGSIRVRLMQLMVQGERFLYLIVLILAGASWRWTSPWILAAAGAYVAARGVSKVLAGWLTTRGLAARHTVPWSVGLGLLSQGGMALAVILDFDLLVGGRASSVLVGIGVLAVIANELLAPWAALRATRFPSRFPSEAES